MSRCDYDGIAASRYHTAEMGPSERDRFEAHLQHCAACSGRVAAQRRLDRTLKALPLYRATLPRPSRRPALIAGTLAAAALIAFVAVLSRERAPRLPPLVASALAADANALAGLTGTPRQTADGPAVSWLGFVTCSSSIAPVDNGVYICAMQRSAPLFDAGVRPGATVVAIAGRPVASDTALYLELARYQPGDRIDVAVRRTGEVRTFRVPLIARQLGPRHPFDMAWSPALMASLDRPRPAGEDLDRILVSAPDSSGLRVARLPSGTAERGSIVDAVSFLFEEGGLAEGDLVTAIDGEPVTSSWDLLQALSRGRGRPLTVLLQREGSALTIRFPRDPSGAR